MTSSLSPFLVYRYRLYGNVIFCGLLLNLVEYADNSYELVPQFIRSILAFTVHTLCVTQIDFLGTQIG